MEFLKNGFTNFWYSTGLALILTCALLTALKHFSQLVYAQFCRHFVSTVELHKYTDCGGDAYNWVLRWAYKHLENCTSVELAAEMHQNETGKYEPKFHYSPAIGTHYFWFKGSFIKMTRTHFQKDQGRGIIILSRLGRSVQVLYDLVKEAEALYNECEPPSNTTSVYVARGDYWHFIGNPRKRRPLSTVYLSDDISERLLKDIEEFAKSEEWYCEHGIPYRRGYLLYGPPGCGKSSFVKAIAGELGKNICTASLSNPCFTDDKLNELFNSTPENSIILLEDIDAAFKERTGCETNITFSGFLNALDGVASTEQRIIFMTTNHLDRLDPALVRPGRVDVRQFIDYPKRDQIEAIFKSFYPKASDEMVAKFADIVGTKKDISVAALQGVFLVHKYDAQEAIENVASLISN